MKGGKRNFWNNEKFYNYNPPPLLDKLCDTLPDYMNAVLALLKKKACLVNSTSVPFVSEKLQDYHVTRSSTENIQSPNTE